MTRPNLFIVGAPKCGTTAWHAYLGTHPNIAFCARKEPHFFNTDMPGFRWTRDEEDYRALFSFLPGVPIIGEASVQYLASSEAARNIAAFNPDAKILIFVRPVAAFLRSYHNQLVLNLDEDLQGFDKAWQACPTRPLPKTCRDPKLLDYRAAGRFGAQVARYLQHFPPEQVHVVRFEDWTANPRTTYLDIMGFLKLDDDGRTDFPGIHAAKQHVSHRLARLTQRPPERVMQAAGILRTILGVKRLGLAGKVRAMNQRAGYVTPPDMDIDAEITAHFTADQALLNDLVNQLRAVRTAGPTAIPA